MSSFVGKNPSAQEQEYPSELALSKQSCWQPPLLISQKLGAAVTQYHNIVTIHGFRHPLYLPCGWRRGCTACTEYGSYVKPECNT